MQNYWSLGIDDLWSWVSSNVLKVNFRVLYGVLHHYKWCKQEQKQLILEHLFDKCVRYFRSYHSAEEFCIPIGQKVLNNLPWQSLWLYYGGNSNHRFMLTCASERCRFYSNNIFTALWLVDASKSLRKWCLFCRFLRSSLGCHCDFKWPKVSRMEESSGKRTLRFFEVSC